MNEQTPPYNAYAPRKPFVSAHSRAQIVTVLLVIGIIVCVFSLLISVLEFFFPAPADAEEISSDPVVLMIALAQIGLALVQLAVYIATVVVFLMWLYRSYENLPAFGVPQRDIKYSSGWAVGSFFVPFVSLVVPYRAVSELWRKSVPQSTAMFGGLSPPGFFGLWWALWIISNIANQIYFRMAFQEEVTSTMSTTVGVVTDVLDIAAALLAIMVVREIDRQQTESSRLIYPQYPSVPPPPPSFGAMTPPETPPTPPENRQI